MEIQQIADRLYELCSQNNYKQAQEELYAPSAKSIEPSHVPGPQMVEGLENLTKKGEMFRANIEEMHGGWVEKPKVFGNYITMEMGMDVKMKGAPRMKMDEMCIFQVEDGKIISEQFFF